MDHPVKDQRWVFHQDIEPAAIAPGVERRVLAYGQEIMCVENRFKKGGVGEIHSHPHTQLTYVVSGSFRFTIGDEEHVVGRGDTLLKKDNVRHGCVCLEDGILLDVFTPMREDFV